MSGTNDSPRGWNARHSLAPRAAIAIGALIALSGASAPTATAADLGGSHAMQVHVSAENGNDRHGGGSARDAVRTLPRAQQLERALAARGERDVEVVVASGQYRLDRPLTFDSRDSGRNGHTVRWQGSGSGARPQIMGSSRVTGWAPGAGGIWSAPVPKGVQSRQLYVDGVLAQRARTELNRADMVESVDGYLPKASAAWLLTMPGIAGAEIEGAGAWTSRFSPIEGVSGGLLQMEQPAWKLNTWGWDTLNHPFHDGPLVVENALALLDTGGEWFLDSVAGRVYYKPFDGQDPARARVELPRLESLIDVAGTLEKPVHNLSFAGLSFSGTTWNRPSTSVGYADQQTSSILTSLDGVDQSNFESTRGKLAGAPSAVQVSAAHDISFSDSTFTNFGANGIGIGNDSNAVSSGVGLGAQRIVVERSQLSEIAGSGIAIGGFLPDAHHPSDPRMIVSDVTITNNVIHDVARYYTGNVGVLLTYAADSTISHNEIFNLPYSGIATGYGWGMTDAGGSSEYERRGTYVYYPRYDTPTTLRNLTVDGNYVHDILSLHTDGAPYYNLGAAPGSVVKNNYFTGSGFGLYYDEGSRYIRTTSNVVVAGGRWWHANYANSPLNGDMVTDGNWSNTASNNSDEPGRNDSYRDNTVVLDQNWPLAARAVIYAAGVAPDLRTGAAAQRSALFANAPGEVVAAGDGPLSITVPVGNVGPVPVTGISARVVVPDGWSASIASVPARLPAMSEESIKLVVTPSYTHESEPISRTAVSVELRYREGGVPRTQSAQTRVVHALPVASPLVGFTTSPAGLVGQNGTKLAIHVAGADVWGAGGQRDDQYGAIFRPQSLSDHGSVTALLDAQEAANEYTKSGVVIRNDLTGAAGSLGYASVYRIAGHGVAFVLDTDGDGYLDYEYHQDTVTSPAVGLRLVRQGANVSGFASQDGGVSWQQVGPTRTLVGATAVVDAGVLHTSHDAGRATTATFSGLSIANDAEPRGAGA